VERCLASEAVVSKAAAGAGLKSSCASVGKARHPDIERCPGYGMQSDFPCSSRPRKRGSAPRCRPLTSHASTQRRPAQSEALDRSLHSLRIMFSRVSVSLALLATGFRLLTPQRIAGAHSFRAKYVLYRTTGGQQAASWGGYRWSLLIVRRHLSLGHITTEAHNDLPAGKLCKHLTRNGNSCK